MWSALDTVQTAWLTASVSSSEVELTDRADLISNQRLLSPRRSESSPPAAWSVVVRGWPSRSLTFSECEQWLWRPRHVVNHQVERLEVVEEWSRLLIHGHGVNDLRNQWKPLLITGWLITDPCVHLTSHTAAQRLFICLCFTMLLWTD